MKSKLRLLSFLFILLCLGTRAQVSVPYTSHFDTNADTAGWTHQAASGTDNWEWGTPTSPNMAGANSTPNAWKTNLDGSYSGNSVMELYSPYFDLSNTGLDLVLSFFQKRHSTSGTTLFYLDYAIGQTGTWQLLRNTTVGQKNWQGVSGFTGNVYTSFQHSAINLSFVQGSDSVRFRFRMVTTNTGGEGWLIDDFSITQPYYNIIAHQGDTSYTTKLHSTFTIRTNLDFYNQYNSSYSVTTNYYFSTDPVLDAGDSLLGNKAANINTSQTTWSKSFNAISGLPAGTYYVIFQHDVLNVVNENVEGDNQNYAVLQMDSIFNVPFRDDLENSPEKWKVSAATAGQPSMWELGPGWLHHLDRAHSGNKAWHTSRTYLYNYSNHFVSPPFLNLTTEGSNQVINFWYQAYYSTQVGYFDNYYFVQYSTNLGSTWVNLDTIPASRNDEWDFYNVRINSLVASQGIKFRISFATNYLEPDGITLDDIYVGAVKPDLSVDRDVANRFSSTLANTDTLRYYLVNTGLAPVSATTTRFYWSTDAVLDGGDVLLGSKNEAALADTTSIWTTFSFTKPTTSPGTYYIFWVLDYANQVDEMREANNSGAFTYYQETPFTIPYLNDFETQTTGWRHNSTLGQDDWVCGVPAKVFLDTAFSGTKAWITKESDLVSTMSRMHLYTPLFNFTGVTRPVMFFDMKLKTNGNSINAMGQMNMTYSLDGGSTWLVLDTTSNSFNRWYYPMSYNWSLGVDQVGSPNYTPLLFAPGERSFAFMTQYNGRNTDRNTRYVLDLGFLAGVPEVQFRFNLGSTGAMEGALVDNFSIVNGLPDLTVSYQKALMVSSQSPWIKFCMDVKNQGTLKSTTTLAKFYLSANQVLDGTDVLLGQLDVPGARPDMTSTVYASFTPPQGWSALHYLIWVVDADQGVIESNESNNVGFWPLALDSISQYPYFQDFNDSILDGWTHYTSGPNGTMYRIRNMKAPGEDTSINDIQSGELFTDPISESLSMADVPFWYVESPSFDFSHLDTIQLSFNIMCTGQTASPGEGGNMEFSTNGGQNWTTMTTAYGTATNWYNGNNLVSLGGQAGWAQQPAGYSTAILNPATFNLCFLRGQNHVQFRYKYRSNRKYYGPDSVQGLRIDNFGIDGSAPDYVALNQMVLKEAELAHTDVSISSSIQNDGDQSVRNCLIRFYWSADTIRDANDVLIFQRNQIPLASGESASFVVSFYYPLPVIQQDYYVLYEVDASQVMAELDETNNKGSYRVHFTDYNGLNPVENQGPVIFPQGQGLVIHFGKQIPDKVLEISMYNLAGQLCFAKKLALEGSEFLVDMPARLSPGVYSISLKTHNSCLSRKIFWSGPGNE